MEIAADSVPSGDGMGRAEIQSAADGQSASGGDTALFSDSAAKPAPDTADTAGAGADSGADAGATSDAAMAQDTGIPQDSAGLPQDAAVPNITGDASKGDATAGDMAQDGSGGPDVSATCPGGAYCPCAGNMDCDVAVCLPTPGGNVCAATCLTECAPGYKCATIAASGGDLLNVCVPLWPTLCDPCVANAACGAIGSWTAACVDGGAAGAFCGSACVVSADCPGGYSCQAVKDVTGAKTNQCVPQDGASCVCSKAALAKQLSTVCFQGFGGVDAPQCKGTKACLPAGLTGAPPGGGLTKCMAPAPTSEQCDALDNDRDGMTDEATCEDKDPCTTDLCMGQQGCKNVPIPGC